MNSFKLLNKEYEVLKNILIKHDIFGCIKNENDLKIFMEKQVFAIWDYMSLMKALENSLRNQNLPWVPNRNGKLIKKLNSITNKEEFDINSNGEIKSHFEMYLEAMDEVNADTSDILNIINHSKEINVIEECLLLSSESIETSHYTKFVYSIIKTEKPHLIATIFALNKNSIVTDYVLKTLQEIDPEKKYKKLLYLLKRHKNANCEDEINTALFIAADLIKNKYFFLNEAIEVAKESLKYKTLFWDGVVKSIERERVVNH